MNLNAAIIGCGLYGQEHAECLRGLGGIEPYLYCDIDLDRAQTLLERFGGAGATDNPAEVFRNDSVDVVYICTHHDTHAPLAVGAIESGKHVFVEKPLALTMRDLDSIGEALGRANVLFMTGFKLRYYPMVDRARAFIDAPMMTIAQTMDARWPDDFWAQDPVAGGGNLLSQGCHMMDLVCYMNDSEPEVIYARGGAFTHEGGAHYDTMSVTIQFENGRVASLAQGDCGATPLLSKWSIQLCDGVRSVHLYDRLKQGVFFDGATTRTVSDAREAGVLGENRAFLESLRTGTPPGASYEHGRRATRMVLAAFESIRTGLPQEFREAR